MNQDHLTIPKAEIGGFVPTLNGMGYMTQKCDHYMKEFARFAGASAHPVLDIGAAYGVATIAALEAGAMVIANDLDERHLALLRQSLEPDQSRQLVTIPGRFPSEIRFCPNSLGVILLARILHFFDGDLLRKSAQQVHDWLVPGGRVVVTAETPYLRNWRSFIPVYEDRVRRGVSWPGFVDDVQSIAPERGVNLPKTMHLLDPDVLTRVFSECGFVVEQSEMFARPEFPPDIQLDGRESVGLIAIKQ